MESESTDTVVYDVLTQNTLQEFFNSMEFEETKKDAASNYYSSSANDTTCICSDKRSGTVCALYGALYKCVS